MPAPNNTFKFFTDSDDIWYVFHNNDCPHVDEIHLADILEPLSENPGWRFHFPFGMNGIEEVIAQFKELKCTRQKSSS